MKTSSAVTTPVTTQQLYAEFIAYKKGTKGLTPSGAAWFRFTLLPFLEWLPVSMTDVSRDTIAEFLGQYNHMPWRKHGFYRALRTFFKWHSISYQVPNPFIDQFGNSVIDPPKVPQKLLNTLTPDKIAILVKEAKGVRNKALISLLADSGARRSEVAGIQVHDLDLERCRIKVWGKDGKEGWLIFGSTTKLLLSQHIQESSPQGSLFGLTSYSIQTMLRRLGDRVGIRCPAHSFRRGFATELRRKGLSELDIAELGRWSSTAMVKRYSRAYTFDDAASRYQSIV